MGERERHHEFERFDRLQFVQTELARRGFFFHPIPNEHTEGLVTGPLLHRLRTHIKKHGFQRVAGHVAITFSGLGADNREIYAIPEVRAYWKALDAQLPELPALLATLPAFAFNGPGQHVMLLGTVDAVFHDPGAGGFTVHVADGPRIIADAVARIRQAGRKYHLAEATVRTLVDHFTRNAGAG
jgi:hypothetical protein